MKRLEQRERENLGRIFYTMIRVSPDNPISPDFGRYRIRIELIFSPDTLLPIYIVGVIKDKEYLIVKTSILIDQFSGSYDIKEFKVTGGLMTLRGVLEEIKNEKGRVES
jgi:hypothetical protein